MQDIIPNNRTLSLARHLRSNQTGCERILWSRLRSFKRLGYHFRRQVPLGPFVVDFLCKEARLIVEADGEQHAQEPNRSHDLRRDAVLESQGFAVLRYANCDIRRELDGVCDAILAALKRRLSFAGLAADAKNERFERARIETFTATVLKAKE